MATIPIFDTHGVFSSEESALVAADWAMDILSMAHRVLPAGEGGFVVVTPGEIRGSNEDLRVLHPTLRSAAIVAAWAREVRWPRLACRVFQVQTTPTGPQWAVGVSADTAARVTAQLTSAEPGPSTVVVDGEPVECYRHWTLQELLVRARERGFPVIEGPDGSLLPDCEVGDLESSDLVLDEDGDIVIDPEGDFGGQGGWRNGSWGELPIGGCWISCGESGPNGYEVPGAATPYTGWEMTGGENPLEMLIRVLELLDADAEDAEDYDPPGGTIDLSDEGLQALIAALQDATTADVTPEDLR